MLFRDLMLPDRHPVPFITRRQILGVTKALAVLNVFEQILQIIIIIPPTASPSRYYNLGFLFLLLLGHSIQ